MTRCELVNNICKRWGLFQTCLHNEVGKVKQGYLEVNYLCQVFKVVSMKLHHITKLCKFNCHTMHVIEGSIKKEIKMNKRKTKHFAIFWTLVSVHA